MGTNQLLCIRENCNSGQEYMCRNQNKISEEGKRKTNMQKENLKNKTRWRNLSEGTQEKSQVENKDNTNIS